MSINPTSSKLTASCKPGGTLIRNAVNPGHASACRGPAQLPAVGDVNPLWNRSCCPNPLYYPADTDDDAIIAGDTPAGCHFDIMATVIVNAAGGCSGCYYDGTNFANHEYLLSSGSDTYKIPWVPGATSILRITRALVWCFGQRHDDTAGISNDSATVWCDVARSALWLDPTPSVWTGRFWCSSTGTNPPNNCQYNPVTEPAHDEVASLSASNGRTVQVFDWGGFRTYDSTLSGTYFWGVGGGPQAGFRIDSNSSWGGSFRIAYYIGQILCP